MRDASIWAWAALVMAAVVLVSGLGCGSSGMGDYGAAAAPCTLAGAVALPSSTVSLRGMAFVPACAKVAAGTVTFRNDDGIAHTVTADSGAFDDALPGTPAGQQVTETFGAAAPSGFGIHCKLHPGMRMTLFVE